MAEVVLGIGTSHSPQLSVPWQDWQLMREKDETDPRLDYAALVAKAPAGLDAQLTHDVWQQRYDACQQGIKAVGKILKTTPLDAIVIFGDDQHEQFGDENMPAVAIYHGETCSVVHKDRGPNHPKWMDAEAAQWENKFPEYPAHPNLARHLISSLTEQEFEVTRCSELRPDIGIGHAFSFPYRRVWPECNVPIVPVMVNTYYPPNQPTPRRCYALGQAVRQAVECWEGGQRVAIMGSGGLSHVIIDEDLDKFTLDGILSQDPDKLAAIPRDKLRGGTSEILNWVALCGATQHLKPTLIDYVPTYRSPAATGCGMTFAYWN
ncbi:MAG TPA: extradiol ring-cleavage dioxygenase [Chloroflexota bacterium]|nr:extradiol ring-cleavage dioxygenase [Chloroflexota bacterium]